MLAFDRDLLSPLLNLGWLGGCLLAAWCIGRPYGAAPVSLALGAIALQRRLRRPGGRGPQRHRRRLLPPRRGRDRPQRLPRPPRRASRRPRRPARCSSSGSRPAWPPGPSSTTSRRRRAGPRRSPRSRLAAGAGASLGARPAARRSPGAATGTCATSSTPATRCPGSTTSGRSRLPAPEPGPRRPRGAQRPRLPRRRLGLVGLVPARPPPGLWRALAAARRARPRRRSCSASAGARAPPCGSAASSAWRRPRLAGRADLGLGARGHAARLRLRAALPGPGAGPRPGAPAARGAPPRRLARCPRVELGAVPAYARSAADLSGRTLAGAGGPGRRCRCLARCRVAIAVGVPRPARTTSRTATPTRASLTPGLDAAFKWARRLSGARIATTSTRQYPLFGTDLSNRVQFVGDAPPHAGFVAPATCRAWRRSLNEGDYDYVVASRDGSSPASRPSRPRPRWTASGPARTRRSCATPPDRRLSPRRAARLLADCRPG